jgi:predicted DCC family thiol-disulfide oxidoreductase YuxK
VILVENGKAYTHSTGALRVVRRLGFPWSLIYAFIVVPRPIRDYFYRLFAKYRYRFFGKKDQCMIPTPEVRSRFLT